MRNSSLILILLGFGLICSSFGRYAAEADMALGTLRCEFIYEKKVCWNPKETIEDVKDD